jgi:hypothetical protein
MSVDGVRAKYSNKQVTLWNECYSPCATRVNGSGYLDTTTNIEDYENLRGVDTIFKIHMLDNCDCYLTICSGIYKDYYMGQSFSGHL